MISDLAGIFELAKMVFGFILYKVSKHSFVLTAVKYLFLVNTQDEDLFDNQKFMPCDPLTSKVTNVERKMSLNRGINKYTGPHVHGRLSLSSLNHA